MKALVFAKTKRKLGFWLFESVQWMKVNYFETWSWSLLTKCGDSPWLSRSPTKVKLLVEEVLHWSVFRILHEEKWDPAKPRNCLLWSQLSGTRLELLGNGQVCLRKLPKASFTPVHPELREMTANGMQKGWEPLDKVYKESCLKGSLVEGMTY